MLDEHLPFPVVAAVGRFEDRGQADLDDRLVQGAGRIDHSVRRNVKPVRNQRLLFAQAVSANLQHEWPRPHGLDLGRGRQRRGWDILKFKGQHVGCIGERFGGGQVGKIGIDLAIGHLRGRAARRRIKNLHAITEPMSRQGKHAAELAAPENADRPARADEHRARIRFYSRCEKAVARDSAFAGCKLFCPLHALKSRLRRGFAYC